MSRSVVLTVAMLAGCHEAPVVVVSPPSPAQPLELSEQTIAAWEAFCERPSWPDCDLPRSSEDAMAGIPDAEDPDAVVAWIRSQVPETVGSSHGSPIAGELWFRYDGLPPERRAELLPELRALARHEFLDAQDRRMWSHEAWLRLAALEDPEILPLLRTALADPHDWVGQLAAAEALREYGEDADAPGAQALYEALGKGDPGWPVVFTEIVWGADPYPAERRYAPWSVVLEGQRVSFDSKPDREVAVPEALADLRLVSQFPTLPGIRGWMRSLTVARPIAGGWLLGTNAGEFGGDAWWVDAEGKATHLAHTNVVDWIELRGTPYLLTGLAHMGSRQGALLEVQPGAEGVALRYALTLPDAPLDYEVRDDWLLMATKSGVGVVSTDLSLRLLPYATDRTLPTELPTRYPKIARRRTAASKTAIEACLAPLRGRTSGCSRKVPPGVGLWLEVDEVGAVSATAGFSKRDDPRSRPPTPEVVECLDDVVRAWTFDPAPRGWTTFGVVFEVGRGV